MSTRNVALTVHPLSGGLDTTSPPTAMTPGWFSRLENVVYNVHSIGQESRVSIKKRLGTAKYNATQLTSTGAGGDTFTNISDFWRFGASLTPSQKFVAVAGDRIVKDDGDGIWDELKTSWGTNANVETNIIIAQGYAVFSNGVDTPQKWDQSTVTDLSVTGTIFTDAAYHLRRLFKIGIPSLPSRVAYSAAGDITDEAGGDTGNFTLDEDDEDRIIGVSHPFRGRLYFFKGPHMGSVHELAGRTVSTFTLDRLFTGAPCVAHRGIITTPNDIYWISRYGIHSLIATQKFGDTEEQFVSFPIQSEFNKVNFARLNQAVGFYHPTEHIVGWFVPMGSASQNDTALVYNFRAGRWTTWKFGAFRVASCSVNLTPTTQRPRLYLGGYAGYAYAGGQTTLADDSTTAYTAKVRSPNHMRLGDASELLEKTFYRLTTFCRPVGHDIAATVTVDGARTQTATISTDSGSGGIIGEGLIGTMLIGSTAGALTANTAIEDRGETVQVEWTQGGVNEDMELYGYAITFSLGEGMSQE